MEINSITNKFSIICKYVIDRKWICGSIVAEVNKPFLKWMLDVWDHHW